MVLTGYNWSNTWQLQIAVDKCFVCRLFTKKCVTHKNYSVNNVPLFQVDEVR